MTRILFVLAALATAVPATAPGQGIPEAELARRANALVAQGKIKGVVLGVIDSSGARRIVSAGTSAGSRPLDSESLFEIASINKTMTALLLADMVAAREVALEDPVAKYLPAGARVPSRGREITLLDLATHRSGLPNSPPHQPADSANPVADFTVQTLYDFLSRHELTREVGSQYEYTTVGFGLLGHALARAARAGSYDALLRQRILAPLGMRSTTFSPSGDLAARTAKGHDGAGKAVRAWDVTDALAGGAGLWSSATDLLTFVDAHLGSPTTALERAARAAIAVRHERNPQLSGGLAWAIRQMAGRRIVSHTGGTRGSHVFVGFDPDRQVGVVVLANSSADDAGVDQLAFDILAPTAAEAAVPEATLSQYAGEYELAPGRALVVSVESGKLFGQPPGQQRMPLAAESESVFFVGRLGGPIRIRFVRGEGGTVTGLVLTQNGNDRTAPKIR